MMKLFEVIAPVHFLPGFSNGPVPVTVWESGQFLYFVCPTREKCDGVGAPAVLVRIRSADRASPTLHVQLAQAFPKSGFAIYEIKNFPSLENPLDTDCPADIFTCAPPQGRTWLRAWRLAQAQVPKLAVDGARL